MTNRKAIGILEVMKSAGELMLVEDEQEALDMAMEALEFKEKYEPLVTPKKPIIITDWPFKNDEVCPNCKEDNIRYPDVGWMYKHCPDCGQALKEALNEQSRTKEAGKEE